MVNAMVNFTDSCFGQIGKPVVKAKLDPRHLRKYAMQMILKYF
jgi:hypothetical protein